MLVLGRPLTLATLVTALTLGHANVARAADARPEDTGATPAPTEAAAPSPVRWHGSALVLNQRVGTQTVGVGADYQSRNPFYDVALYFRPRYYLWERERSALSLRAQAAGTYEVTNSDSTTQRGELILEDTTLSLVPEHTFGAREEKTLVSVSVPRLVLPTSKPSRRSGKIVDAGARVVVDHEVPLRARSQVLQRAHVGGRLGYSYQFVTGTVPTSDTLNRLRMTLDAKTANNHQLAGAAFADHSFALRGIVGADLYADWLSFDFELGIDPAHKRELPRPLVKGLATGPYEARSVDKPVSWIPVTYLDTSINFDVKKVLKLAVGYENITAQIGPNGKRQKVFYSRDAKFYVAAELVLDKAYDAFRGRRAPAKVALVR